MTQILRRVVITKLDRANVRVGAVEQLQAPDKLIVIEFIVEPQCRLRSINVWNGGMVLPTEACGMGVQIPESAVRHLVVVVGGGHPVDGTTSHLRSSQQVKHLRHDVLGATDIVRNVMEAALHKDYIRLPAILA